MYWRRGMPSSGGSGQQPWERLRIMSNHDTSQQQGQPMAGNLVLLIASPSKICFIFLFPTPPCTHSCLSPLKYYVQIFVSLMHPPCIQRWYVAHIYMCLHYFTNNLLFPLYDCCRLKKVELDVVRAWYSWRSS